MMFQGMIDKMALIRNMFRHHGSNTPFFSLNGLKAYARVIDVYDGDTITIVLDINGYFLKFKCRLDGIDTCELRSKHIQNKIIALQARNRLFQLITGKQISSNDDKKYINEYLDENVCIAWVHCLEFDKYGRVLIDCYSSPDSTKSFSSILLEEKLAYSYQGETKLTDEQQISVLTH